jgi:hypothetical protein
VAIPPELSRTRLPDVAYEYAPGTGTLSPYLAGTEVTCLKFPVSLSLQEQPGSSAGISVCTEVQTQPREAYQHQAATHEFLASQRRSAIVGTQPLPGIRSQEPGSPPELCSFMRKVSNP